MYCTLWLPVFDWSVVRIYPRFLRLIGPSCAGDGLDEANFVEETANANILRLTKELAWIEEQLAPSAGLRGGAADTFGDRVFAAEIELLLQTTLGHYDNLNFREALNPPLAPANPPPKASNPPLAPANSPLRPRIHPLRLRIHPLRLPECYRLLSLVTGQGLKRACGVRKQLGRIEFSSDLATRC
eukprot:1179468-Prorocentrum_minimum.AAC.1